MAKFIFKLQSLLNVKINMEENLKNELGKAMQFLEKEKSILKQFEYEEEQCIKDFNSETERGVTVEKLRKYNSYIYYLRGKIKTQKENVNSAKKNVDKVREELIKVMQEREMLEKLKEKRYEAYLKEQLGQEQRLNDELTSYKHNISAGE